MDADPAATTRFPLPRPKLADGTVEALKWIALVLMTGDHVNRYLLGGAWPALFDAGRLAMPVFVCVLAYNLARPVRDAAAARRRTMRRLALFGLLATPPYVALGGTPMGGWWPLNILFTLLAIVGAIHLLERRTAEAMLGAAAVVFVGGICVEFFWPAIMLGVAVWAYCRTPSWWAALAACAACAALWPGNGSHWALLGLALPILATRVRLHLPRMRYAFYLYYPAHLAALWSIRILVDLPAR